MLVSASDPKETFAVSPICLEQIGRLRSDGSKGRVQGGTE